MSNNTKTDFFIYALIFLSIAPLFSMQLAIWLIPITTLLFFFNLSNLKKRKLKWDFGLLIPVFFFLILIVGLLYTSNFNRGVKIVERFLSFAILPLIFGFASPLINFNRIKIIKAYIYANAIFYIIAFFYAFYRQMNFTLTKGGSINWYYFYRYDFLIFFHQHPTYVSMMVLIALSFVIFLKSELHFSKQKNTLLFILFSLGILFTGSRQGYMQYFLIITLFFVLKIKNAPYKQKYILNYLGGLILFILMSFNVPIIKERILITLGADRYYKFYYNKHISSTDNPEKQGRLLLWQDAWQLIKDKPFLGQGTGGDNDALIAQYKKNGHTYLFQMGYNAHNSYIQWLLSGGIVLLTVWLSMLFTIFYKGIKTRDPVLWSFFIILFFTGFTETFYRVQGIIFIAFFYSFLLILENDNKKLSA